MGVATGIITGKCMVVLYCWTGEVLGANICIEEDWKG